MQNENSRRKFLKSSGMMLGAISAPFSLAASNTSDAIKLPKLSELSKPPAEIAKDENYWRQVRQLYSVTDDVINLENGYWGIMSDPVLKAYQANTQMINRNNTSYARRQWGQQYNELHKTVAEFLNLDPQEIVLTRGATEALQALIGGYNQLKPGDKVLYADLDYSEMKNAIRWLEERRGVEVIKIDFPEPASWENVTELYRKTFDQHPEIKLTLMTHLNNWTGLICPVKQIASMAKKRGIDIILDAAHSVGHIDFDIRDLGCDFVGVNLHKWVGAPIGCGVMVINKKRIKHIDDYMGKISGHAKKSSEPNIQDRADTGTVNFAAYLTIPKAIEFHRQIGTKLKQTRLKYLRDIWVNDVRGTEGIQIMTPDDSQMVGALTSFRLNGQTSTEANNAISKRLAEQYGILTVRRTGPALGDCVRVTPSVYNYPEEMFKLARALKDMVKS